MYFKFGKKKIKTLLTILVVQNLLNCEIKARKKTLRYRFNAFCVCYLHIEMICNYLLQGIHQAMDTIFFPHKCSNFVLPVLLQSIKHKVQFKYCINRSVMFFQLLPVQRKRVSLSVPMFSSFIGQQ